MIMMTLPQIAAAVIATGSIGGGAIALDHMHVASEDFKEYIEQEQEADERSYILQLKKDIREVKTALVGSPSEGYLIEALAEMIAELCLIRVEDRLCKSE